jgi:uncharacterized RDD family membrane protein YckC
MITEVGATTAAPDTPGPEISGFWRRIAGIALDSLILGALGVCIGLLWFDSFAALGSTGRLIGGAIAFAYFAILNSDVAGGQTLGKRLLSIRVVSKQGAPVGLARSGIRALVLLAPLTLNGMQFPALENSDLAAIALSVCIFGMGGALVYLYVFNRATRQSLHDYATGTFVVRTGAGGPVTREIWQPHLAIVSVWILAVAVGVVPLMAIVGSTETIESINETHRALRPVLPTADVTVHTGISHVANTSSGVASVRFLEVRVRLRNRPTSYEKVAERFAAALLARPENWDVDQVSIVVTFGYDIMISSMSTTRKFSHSPNDWATRLDLRLPPKSDV